LVSDPERLLQLQSGKWVRIWPAKKGTFDCSKSNYVKFQSDLEGT
jgi:hypothetical protein